MYRPSSFTLLVFAQIVSETLLKEWVGVSFNGVGEREQIIGGVKARAMR
jgi:hypothetical protein